MGMYQINPTAWTRIVLAAFTFVLAGRAHSCLAEEAPGAAATPATEGSPRDAENSESPFNPLLISNNPKAHAYANELRGPIIVELGFAKRVAGLSPAQLKTITATAQDALFEAAADYAVRPGKLNGGRYYPPPFNPETSEDVVRPVVARVREKLAAAMSDKQRQLYLEAVAAQDKFQQQACLESLVSRLEILLVLTEQQRDGIREALAKSWDARWEDTGAMRHIHVEGIPNVPTSVLKPHLDAEQLKAWTSLHKDSWYSGHMVLGVNNKIPTDIPWDHERHR
jgi:hypothetical protein